MPSFLTSSARRLRLVGLLLPVLVPVVARPLAAQGGGRDTTAADSARLQRLRAVRVEVTRTGLATDRMAWAVGAQTAVELRRGQATLGIDEALNNIPGVVVSNRYNYAVDQRLSIRGAGSRANFGLRGVKVLLDGVPQSLPDGQSQLTNVDLASIGRVEVLRGSASSLYGNGSGGVIAFTTDLTAPDRLGASTRVMGGSFGTAKSLVRVSGRAGNTVGALFASRTTVDGSRQFSSADVRQLTGAMDHALGARTVLSVRAGTSETPESLNPGALTLAEYEANRDSAAANNIRRGASKEVSQRFLSLRVRRSIEGGEVSASVYGQRRLLSNPLAVAPPAPAGPANGTVVTLDRRVTGLRADASRQFAARGSPRVAAGVDVQRAHDVRRNQRTTGGRPVAADDTLLTFQNETMTSVGPFAQVQVDPHPRLTVSAGGRWDRIGFAVDDRFLQDGSDDSAERSMTAASGHVGAVWRAGGSFVPYANISTAFETPTTTELAARSDGQGGFNPDLGPQDIVTMEVGARGRLGRATYEVALFNADANDAIVQHLETSGRAFFRNAGRTRSRGLELGLSAEATDWLQLRAAYTLADYKFTDYTVPSATLPAPALDTLDGNFMAGVPANVLRLGARTLWRGFSLDVDHTLQSGLWADDRNAVRVDSWGSGHLNARLAWGGHVAGWRFEPFVSVQNALDTDYVGAVTLNGFGGRVIEPAPLRNWFMGIEVGAPILR
jgi:iron complex outermembrane receptor protein